MSRSLRKIVFTIAGVVLAGLAGVVLFAWSGLYNVAASRGHLAITRIFLEFALRNSVETHASGIAAPALDDPALFERGIGHYQGGCAPCHGAPGIPPSVVAQQELPPPPELSQVVGTWTREQLFWIVKHGIKYTGMPAWPAQVRDDEVWAVVAFLERLPATSPEEYRRRAILPVATGEPARVISTVGIAGGDPIACARCHGLHGEGGPAGGVPRIAGQRQEYLLRTLVDYDHGTRPSGIMQPVAGYLTREQKQSIAEYYAGLAAGPAPAVSPVAEGTRAELVRMGEALALTGDARSSIPACAACHGALGRAESRFPGYPALAGQHFDYLRQQLELWRAGVRGGTFGPIMTAAVRNITDEQIRAVALYYSQLPP